jgi:hypothetical protein
LQQVACTLMCLCHKNKDLKEYVLIQYAFERFIYATGAHEDTFYFCSNCCLAEFLLLT